MKYLVKTKWWSLFDRHTLDEQRIVYRIIEADSVEELLANHEKEQRGWLDAGVVILKVWELGELKYNNEPDIIIREVVK